MVDILQNNNTYYNISDDIEPYSKDFSLLLYIMVKGDANIG